MEPDVENSSFSRMKRVFSWIHDYLYPQPSSLKLSDGLVNELKVEKRTKGFLLALREPSSGGVLYIIPMNTLAKSSDEDTRAVIDAVKPDTVVAFGSLELIQTLREDRSSYTDDSARLNQKVPATPLGVLAMALEEGIAPLEFEERAIGAAINCIFGTNAFINMAEARKAAGAIDATFLYAGNPADQLVDEEAEAESSLPPPNDADTKPEARTTRTTGEMRLHSAPLVLLTSYKQATGLLSRFMQPAEVSKDPGLPYESETQTQPLGKEINSQFVRHLDFLLGLVASIDSADLEVRNAYVEGGRLMQNVAAGKEVELADLEKLAVFREVGESLRVLQVRQARKAWDAVKVPPKKVSPVDFGAYCQMGNEDRAILLAALAMRQLTRGGKVVVAAMHGPTIPGLVKYWHAEVDDGIDDLAMELVMPPTIKEDDNLLKRNGPGIDGQKKQDTGEVREHGSAPVVVGVGAAGAAAVVTWLGIAGTKWGSSSGLVKLLGFKVPSMLKTAVSVLSRNIVSKSVAAPMAKAGLSLKTASAAKAGLGLKTVPVAKAGLGLKAAGSTSATATGGKTMTASFTSKDVMPYFLDTVRRMSLRLVRTAVYNVMKAPRRRGGINPTEALYLGGTVGTCGALFWYNDHLVQIGLVAPVAPQVARLGQGLQRLQSQSELLEADEVYRRRMDSFVGKCRWAKEMGLGTGK